MERRDSLCIVVDKLLLLEWGVIRFRERERKRREIEREREKERKREERDDREIG